MGENPFQVTVRRAEEKDLRFVALLNGRAFAGNRAMARAATQWVHCWWAAFPMYQYFIAEYNGEPVGYIGWQVHGGFLREQMVLELEQIATVPEYQNRGIASQLCEKTIPFIVEWAKAMNPQAKKVVLTVWAYTLNGAALRTYEKFFADGAQGMRIQYGDTKSESMLRGRIAL